MQCEVAQCNAQPMTGVSYGLKQTSDNSSSTQSSVQETRPCSESEDAEETTPAPARLKCDVKSRPTDAKDPRIPPRPKIRRSSPRSQSLSARAPRRRTRA